jgi:XapX domain-containing protein
MKIVLRLVLALSLGVGSRLVGLPLPAPLALTGAVLELARSAGYEVVDRLAPPRGATQRENCGGSDADIGTTRSVSRRTVG